MIEGDVLFDTPLAVVRGEESGSVPALCDHYNDGHCKFHSHWGSSLGGY